MAQVILDQGSKEWHEWRYQHITATDASVIMGSNPWKKPLHLWEEKLGFREPEPMNDAMRRGQALEDEAREYAWDLICKKHPSLFGSNNEKEPSLFDVCQKFQPGVFVNDGVSWQGASLDGFTFMNNGCMAILEIKCPKEKIHAEAGAGIVPAYYLDQMQHQLCVTDAEICFFVTYRPEDAIKMHLVEIHPNKEYHKQLLVKEGEFWRKLKNVEPPSDWTIQIRM